MKRIAIVGGGISGLTAAYELEKARQAGAPLDWHLFEASDRLGGIIKTTRLETPDGEYILEGGPDGWVTEKPWARELVIELGLEDQLISSNDSTRKTYILFDGELQAIPDRMRLMVPENLDTLEGSPLFSPAAKQAYASELARADELRTSSPLLDSAKDESIASFVLRHFGEEVLTKLAAPLLSGVFGGDVHKLSVRAVMPQFVRMEHEHGSLILALQHERIERDNKPPRPIFTSLRRGMASLVEALIATLPDKVMTLSNEAVGLEPTRGGWKVYSSQFRGLYDNQSDWTPTEFDYVLLCTSARDTKALLHFLPHRQVRLIGFADPLIPVNASSSILVSYVWSPEAASTFKIPPGFGFLVPERVNSGAPCSPAQPAKMGIPPQTPELLACTFVDQKFPHRAPAGACVLRAFFGGDSAEQLSAGTDEQIARAAFTQLRAILGSMPEPQHIQVRRWPRSLPQYEVGHLERMAQLDKLLAKIPGLTLLGNSYRGIGIPDLIRDARTAVRTLVDGLNS